MTTFGLIEDRPRPDNRRFALALAASLLLHAAVLFFEHSAPEWQPQKQGKQAPSRLDVTLAPPAQPETQPPSPRQKKPQKHVLALSRNGTPRIVVPNKSWSIAEREDMNQFLNELSEESRPVQGKALAQRALAMARSMHSPESAEDGESKEIMRKLVEARVDPFSLEMYFDALFRKMNQSAARIGNERRRKGLSVAAVRVMLKQDGSVRSFEILNAGDQQAEIAFIKEVVDMAAPFPAFPPDIRSATSALGLLICIHPGMSGSGGGGMFTRMGEGQVCR